MVDIAAVTATATGLVALLKDAVRLAKERGDEPLNKTLIELQGKVLELQSQLVDLASDNLQLKQTISDLERASEITEHLIFEEPFWWQVKDGKREGPFCSICWDKDQRLIHVSPYGTKGSFSCQACKGFFTSSEYISSRARVRSRGFGE